VIASHLRLTILGSHLLLVGSRGSKCPDRLNLKFRGSVEDDSGSSAARVARSTVSGIAELLVDQLSLSLECRVEREMRE